MNKAELVEVVATRIDASKKDAAEAVQAVVDAITEAVARGQKVSISGFGVFEKAARPARTYHKPSTGEAISKMATQVPRFRPGGDFRALVAGEKALSDAVKAASDVAGEAVRLVTGRKSAPAEKAEAPKPAAAAPVKKAPAKKAPAKTTTATKAPAKKAPAKKAAPATAAASEATAPAKQAPAKKAPAKKAPAKKATTATATTAKKAPAKRTPAKKAPAATPVETTPPASDQPTS